jgi:hypothetical protein
MDPLDIVASFDPIDRIEGAVSTFLNADWIGAFERHGVAGVITEFVACVTSYNAPTIRVSRRSHWSGRDIERLLKRYGVRIWDRGLAGPDLSFCVKRRQVRWAEYLLLRAGVPVTSILNEPRNLSYASRYEPGSLPPQNRPRRR